MQSAIRRLPDALRARARVLPDRVAHDDTERRITFAAWDRNADEIAGGLVAAGIRPGDRVLLGVDNTEATFFAEAFIGIQRAGAIPAPLNTRLRTPEVVAYTRVIGATAGITNVDGLLDGIDLAHCWTTGGVPRDPEAVPAPDTFAPDEVADIIATSGTTGLPKGVVFRHDELVEGIDPTSVNRSSSLAHALPFTGFGGCHGVMLLPLRLGTTVITQPRFDAARFVDLVDEHRPVSLQLVPSMLRLLLDDAAATPDALESVRWIFTGTAPLPHDTVARIADRWPRIRIINVYGMTEGGGGTQTPDTESVSKPGSVGRPRDPDRVRVCDPTGDPVPTGAVGEIWTRPDRTREYWNDPEGSAEVWRDGWVRTGDLGRIDADGDLILVGRAKELIIRGGYNIAPTEVEDVLHGHPDVVDAAVVGIGHEVLGEDVGAAVVLASGATSTEDDLLSWCRQRLADNKVPRVLVAVDTLPMNQNGKVVKRELRPLLEAARGRVDGQVR